MSLDDIFMRRYVFIATLITLSNHVVGHDALNKTLNSYFEGREYTYTITFLDLNDDGGEEALIYLQDVYWCGMGGCTLLIFERIKDDFIFLSKIPLVHKPVFVADTRSNGWLDIYLHTGKMGLVVIKFDGVQYPQNPSLQPKGIESAVNKKEFVFTN